MSPAVAKKPGAIQRTIPHTKPTAEEKKKERLQALLDGVPADGAWVFLKGGHRREFDAMDLVTAGLLETQLRPYSASAGFARVYYRGAYRLTDAVKAQQTKKETA